MLEGSDLSVCTLWMKVKLSRQYINSLSSSSISSSNIIIIISSIGWRTVDCKASPTGSVLGSAHDVILWEIIVGVNLFLDLAGEDLRGLPSSPMGGLIQRVKVHRFIFLHAQNVAKERELSKDDRRQQRAGASEIVNSVIWDFVQAFDI